MGNLSLPTVPANTVGNYLKSNEADNALDLSMTNSVVVTVTTADVALNTGDPENANSQIYKALRNQVFICQGAMTGARNVIVPTNKKFYTVINENTGGFTLTVKTQAGTGIGMANGDIMILYCDGTNVRQITAAL